VDPEIQFHSIQPLFRLINLFAGKYGKIFDWIAKAHSVKLRAQLYNHLHKKNQSPLNNILSLAK
jgi:hypothetical protein